MGKWMENEQSNIFSVKRLLRMIGMVAGSALVATGLLTLCFLLPVSSSHFQESRDIFAEEEWYPNVLAMGSTAQFQSYLPGVLDNNTDYIMFTTALDDNPGRSPLSRAMRMYSFYSGDYSYYWHGYVLILRPLFLLFHYGELRYLNGIAQIFLLLSLSLILYRQRGLAGVVLLWTAYAMLMPVALIYSFQYSWVYYIAILSAIILLRHRQYWENGNRYIYLFLMTGVLTSFLDLLTYPLFTWGFPVLLWLYTDEGKRTREYLSRVVQSALCWILGYGGMWASKWLLGSLILRQNVLQSAMQEARLRTGATDQATWYMHMQAFRNNWNHYADLILLLFLLGWLVCFLLRYLRGELKWDARWPAFLLVGVSPMVWYFVFTEHTRLHHFFTYRIFLISILSVFLILLSCSARKRNWMKEGMARRAAVVILLAALSVLPLFGCMEEQISLNGSGTMEETVLGTNGSFSFSFLPQHKRLVQLVFDLSTESETGNLTVLLTDAHGSEIKKKELPLARLKEQEHYTLELDCSLDTGEEYTFWFEVTGAEKDVTLKMLRPEQKEGFEIQNGSIVLGETDPDRFPFVSFWYVLRKFPTGKKLLFGMISAMLFWAALLPGHYKKSGSH